MFKNLFSRKKAPVTAANSPAKPAIKKEPVAQTLSQWVESIAGLTGKAQTQTLTKLVEQINNGTFTATDAAAALSGEPALMLKLQFDLPTEPLTAQQCDSLVLNGFTTKVRKLAADQVIEEQSLQTLLKETKGKDKAVYRILQETNDRFQNEKKELAEIDRKRTAVLDGMVKLAAAPLEPMYEAKHRGLIDQWQKLEVSAEQNSAFEAAAATAKEKFTAPVVESNIESSSENQTEHTAATDADSDVLQSHVIEGQSADQDGELATDEAAIDVEVSAVSRQPLIDALTEQLLTSLSQIAIATADVAAEQEALSAAQQQWRVADADGPASKSEQMAFQQVCTAYEIGLPKLHAMVERAGDFQSLVDELNNAERESDALLHEVNDWLKEMSSVLANLSPAPMRMLQDAMDKYQSTLAEQRQKETEMAHAIRGQLRRCQAAVADGSLRRASGLFHGVEEKLEGFDLSRHGGLKKQLEETTAAVEKLRDWQSYAVLPKKEALIKKMAALVGQHVDPETRAESIRDMQDEWKQLSRGLQNRQQDLWETFHELAQKAYEPCKEFFSEQRHLRDINLAKRKEVVEQLETYMTLVNWDEPDTNEIDKVLQVARNDWRRYSPVNRVASKKVQSDFDKLHKHMFDVLRKEQTQVKAVKEGIVASAQALLELDDVKQATEQAKALQQQWKQAGSIARKDEQQLWQTFRKVCDELFAKREQQVTAFKSDLEDNRKAAVDILAKLAELQSAANPLTQKAAFEELRAQYDALGTLPKTDYAKLTADYKTKCAAFEAACKQASVNAADQHWKAIIDWVKIARFDDITNEALLEQWAEIKVPPVAKKLVDCLQFWLQQPVDANAEKLRELTIDLEIMCDVDSPSDDASQRMNLQVQRLADGIGAASNTRADIDAAVVEWLAIGSVESNVYEQLEARMEKARKAGIK